MLLGDNDRLAFNSGHIPGVSERQPAVKIKSTQVREEREAPLSCPASGAGLSRPNVTQEWTGRFVIVSWPHGAGAEHADNILQMWTAAPAATRSRRHLLDRELVSADRDGPTSMFIRNTLWRVPI